MSDSFSIMVHGGAGALDNVKTDKDHVRYLESIRTTLEYGRTILSQGGSALQAVEACAGMLEDDPKFNAGCGSVLNEDGKVEMDAGIMEGRSLKAGAVAGIHNIANPITLARIVLERSEHVMLIGAGAMRFAEMHGVERMDDPYFLTQERIEQYKLARIKGRMILDHEDLNYPDNKFGTIGAVARDRYGDFAAATSTGGIVYKKFGRVGDSPILGCGVYADNDSCAVSTTGYGEDFMRTVFAKSIADRLLYCSDKTTEQNADDAIAYFKERVSGRGGFILIDRQGKCISRNTTRRMIHGWIENNGTAECTF